MIVFWFVYGVIFGAVGYRLVRSFKNHRQKKLTREELINELRKMFTVLPDEIDKIELFCGIEEILSVMRGNTDTNVVTPEKDRSLQKKDNLAPKLTEDEKEIAKKRSEKEK